MTITMNLVTLRPFAASDLDFVCAVRNDPDAEPASQPTPPEPLTKRVFERRYEDGVSAISSGGTHDYEFIVVRSDDPHSTPVGIAGLYDVDFFNGIAELGVTIGLPEARRAGLGLDSCAALCSLAFDTLGLQRVFWQVKSSNESARAAGARLGLTEEGILREHRFCGGRVDLHVFGLLAREWGPHLADWRSRDAETLAQLTQVEVSSRHARPA